MREIINAVTDAEINTKEKAAALISQEAAELAAHYGKPVEEMRAILLSNIGYCTGYLDHAAADRVLELFETEHPIFGKTRPSAEDAYRMGQEYAAKHMKEKLV